MDREREWERRGRERRLGGEREREGGERERERETDRQTDRQTERERETDRQTDRQTDRLPRVSQHAADDGGVRVAPEVVAHGAPLVVVEHHDAARVGRDLSGKGHVRGARGCRGAGCRQGARDWSGA